MLAASFWPMPSTAASSSTVAARMAAMPPKCFISAVRRAAPTPSPPLSLDALDLDEAEENDLDLECVVCCELYDTSVHAPMVLPCSGAHEICRTCVAALRKAAPKPESSSDEDSEDGGKWNETRKFKKAARPTDSDDSDDDDDDDMYGDSDGDEYEIVLVYDEYEDDERERLSLIHI